MAAKTLDFGFEFADAPLQFREAVESRDGFEPLPVLHGRIARVHRMSWDVVGDAAFRGDYAAVAHGEMARGADLAGEDAAIAYFR